MTKTQTHQTTPAPQSEPGRALAPIAEVALAVPEPAATLDRAGRINYYHAVSREAGCVSIAAALAAGAELQRAKAEADAGMFGEWIRRNCQFSEASAYRYLALAERLLPGDAMPRLLEMPPERRREALAESASAIDARTLSELYADLGIVRPSAKRMGGARPGAGRPRRDLDAEVAALNADPALAALECNGYVGKLYEWAITRDGWGCLADRDLVTARATLKDILKRADEIAASREREASGRGSRRHQA